MDRTLEISFLVSLNKSRCDLFGSFSVIIQFSKLPISFKKKMTSELAFEQIKGDYWYAAYGEFKVIIDKSNGFVNATKLCADGGKHFYDWTRNQTGRQLIHALEFLNSNTMPLENSHCEGNTLRDTPL